MQQLPQSQDSAPLRGLSTQQAEALRAQGLSNQQSDIGGKTAEEALAIAQKALEEAVDALDK